MRKLIWLSLISFIVNPLNAVAFKFTPEICQKYNLGKNWYCEAEKIDAKQDELSSSDIMSSNLAPEEKAAQLNKLWEVQRQRAVITSDRGEIEKFLETHNLIVNKGIEFAKNTQSLIEASPVSQHVLTKEYQLSHMTKTARPTTTSKTLQCT